MEGPLRRRLEGRKANLYRRCFNDGEPVLILYPLSVSQFLDEEM